MCGQSDDPSSHAIKIRPIASLEELEIRVSRAKHEILRDIAADIIPASRIRSFADLHDYVDANEYGGLCEEVDDPDAEYVLAVSDETANAVQMTLDRWIISGAMCGDALIASVERARAYADAGRWAILLGRRSVSIDEWAEPA